MWTSNFCVSLLALLLFSCLFVQAAPIEEEENSGINDELRDLYESDGWNQEDKPKPPEPEKQEDESEDESNDKPEAEYTENPTECDETKEEETDQDKKKDRKPSGGGAVLFYDYGEPSRETSWDSDRDFFHGWHGQPWHHRPIGFERPWGHHHHWGMHRRPPHWYSFDF